MPAQSIEPGQPFELWGADLGPSASVAVEIVAGDEQIQVGRVTAGVDGHFTQTMALPAGVPEGYAQLHADSDAGVEAFMWVLVGQNTTGAVNPAAAAGNQWWSDPSVIVLGLMLGGAPVGRPVPRRPGAPVSHANARAGARGPAVPEGIAQGTPKDRLIVASRGRLGYRALTSLDGPR